MRIVIDTNVLISSLLISGLISPKTKSAEVFEQWDKDAFTLLTSAPILHEYEQVLWFEKFRQIHGFNGAELKQVFAKIESASEQIKVSNTIHIIEDDPDDDKFVECAVTGGAEFIVSGDKHLLNLATYQDIEIVDPATFLHISSLY